MNKHVHGNMGNFLSGADIRDKFLKFFKDKGHNIVPSASLIPYDDKTLFFTNAGMVQFKNVFLGNEQRPYKRAVTAQRALRVSGKHNDLETVGRTARHHTFFEMLGNFSFGDYFKREAMSFAWEFLVDILRLPVERLYVTVFEYDDEAELLWREECGVAPDRIFRIGEKDNFWSMGDIGPCGPCSEIFYDRGENYSCDAEDCRIGICDCDRWMEIWNLVFMQFNRDEKGILHPLPKPSIDTGMGLERITAIMQGVDSNFDTDLFSGIIRKTERLSNIVYDRGIAGFPFRVIADHARSCSFLVADGLMPSNEGQGYVLRRILRRAARFGRHLGMEEPFLYKLVPEVISALGAVADVVLKDKDRVMSVIKSEEERFGLTLREGLEVAAQMIKSAKSQGLSYLPGEDAFRLYDTYGFPLDLTKDIGEENNISVDAEGFENAMQLQRQRSRDTQKKQQLADIRSDYSVFLADTGKTMFLGYDRHRIDTKILQLFVDGDSVDSVSEGRQGFAVLEETVFYAEGGGQTGDSGRIISATGKMIVSDTKKTSNGVFLHAFTVEEGFFSKSDSVNIFYDEDRRKQISRNHSATHLLHRALRGRYGEHLCQAGSLVNQDRLRFDFSHFEAISKTDIALIETEINAVIMANLPMKIVETDLETARESGAIAAFGEKYGERVRMVSFGDYSLELCGGTHCAATGEIGSIKLLSEAGIGSGIRRIEALTGTSALAFYAENERLLECACGLLKADLSEIIKKIEHLVEENKIQHKELQKMLDEKAISYINAILEESRVISGIQVVSSQIFAPSAEKLREMADMLKDRLLDKSKDILIALFAKIDDKASMVISVSDALIARNKACFHANSIAKAISPLIEGGGGGRSDLAQAGGKNPSKIPEAVEAVYQWVLDSCE